MNLKIDLFGIRDNFDDTLPTGKLHGIGGLSIQWIPDGYRHRVVVGSNRIDLVFTDQLSRHIFQCRRIDIFLIKIDVRQSQPGSLRLGHVGLLNDPHLDQHLTQTLAFFALLLF